MVVLYARSKAGKSMFTPDSIVDLWVSKNEDPQGEMPFRIPKQREKDDEQ